MANKLEKEKFEQFDIDFNLFQYFDIEFRNRNKKQDFDKIAIHFRNVNVSYSQLYKNVIRINNYLHNKLTQTAETDSANTKNNIVGIRLRPDEHTIPILLAIHSLSLCYLPIDPSLPVERAKYILDDAKPICIITNIEDEFEFDSIKIKFFNLNGILNECELECDSIRTFIHKNEYDSNDLACVLYTSGSTGQPKGVCISHRAIMNRLIWQWRVFEINKEQNDVGAFKTSLNFVDHIAEIFSFILKGLPIVVLDTEILARPDQLIDRIHEFKITYFILVPSLLRNILNYAQTTHNSYKLETVKRWVCSGETLTLDLVNLFMEIFDSKNLMLSNFYGSTEVTGDATYISFNSKKQVDMLIDNKGRVPIGTPISNTSVYLFDENMKQIKNETESGEIYVSGLSLANGYLNESIKNRFITHPEIQEFMFKTGDIGYINNGLLYFLGRNDSQVKIAGKRIDLSELEFYVAKLDEIQTFIPIIYELDGDSRKIIIAFYMSNSDLSESEISKLLYEHLKLFVSDDFIPKYFIKLDKIPLLYNGKVDKQKLKLLFRENYLQKSKETHYHKEMENFLDELQTFTGIQFRNQSNYLELSLSQVGIDSLNTTSIYLKFDLINKHLKFEKFLLLKSLGELISIINQCLMMNKQDSVDFNVFSDLTLNVDEMSHLQAIPFSKNDQFSSIVMRLMRESFAKRSILLSPYPEYHDGLFKLYTPIVEMVKNLNESFIVYDSNKKEYVGGCFNYNWDQQIQMKPNNEYELSYFELLASAKNEVARSLNKKILNATFVTTNINATSQENALIVNFIEDQTIQVAKNMSYEAIITVNTNKLTQDLTLNLKGYKLEKEFQINKFVNSKGIRYFTRIPDSHKLFVCVKYLK